MTRNPESSLTSSIRRNPSFDPTRLRDAAGGFDDAVRPWTWLADPATTRDERAQYLRRWVRGHGTVDPTDRDLTLEARSRRSVISGYLRQQVHLDLPGEPGLRLRLSVADAGAGDGVGVPAAATSGPAIPAGFPLAGAVALIGTTAPAVLAQMAVGRHLAEELADYLGGRGIRSMPALAADSKREWLDELVIAEYPDTEASLVRTAAHTHLQPFLTVWRPEPGTAHGILEVVGVANPIDGEVVARGVARLERVAYRPCPMIPRSGCGDLCTMHGGPWVSRSITAASRWESRRARMIRALGCDTCGDGAITVFAGKVRGGGRAAIPIRPDVSTPTRHDRLAAASTGSEEQTS